MPPPGPDGVYTPDELPDFIGVADRDDGVAGYAPRRYFLANPPEGDIPVFGPDLRTLVGHIVAGIGFVPLGTDPRSLPTVLTNVAAQSPGASRGIDQLTIYVNNQGSTQAWIAMIADGAVRDSQGYGAGLGVGCFRVEIGTQLALLSGHPGDEGVHPLQTLSIQGHEQPRASWLKVESDGDVSFGRGEPDWWPDEGSPCS
jgi:hypothetical protein